MGFGIREPSKTIRKAAFIPLFVAAALILASAAISSPAAALDGEEQAFLGMINQYRAQNGLGRSQSMIS